MYLGTQDMCDRQGVDAKIAREYHSGLHTLAYGSRTTKVSADSVHAGKGAERPGVSWLTGRISLTGTGDYSIAGPTDNAIFQDMERGSNDA